jgi:tetratricopeptide (TPR) repeat protein
MTARPRMEILSNQSSLAASPDLDTPADAAASILSHLERDKAAIASTLLDHALARWPDNNRLLLTKGDVLARTSGRNAAAAHYADLIATSRTLPWPCGRLLSMLESGPLDLDVTLKSAVACAGAAIEPKLKQALLHELVTKCDPAERLGLLEKIVPVCGLFRFELRLAVTYAERGSPDAALKVLEAAAADGRSTSQAVLLRAELLALCGRLDECIETLERHRAESPDYAEAYRRLIMYYQRSGAFESATNVLEDAIQRWPVDWMLLFRLNRLPIVRDRLNRIFAQVRAAAHPVAEKDGRVRYQFALACLDAGEVEEGLHLLEQPFDEPVASMVRPVITALCSRPARRWVTDSRLRDDRTAEVQVTRARMTARASVVVTAGPLFGNLPIAFLDALLATHDVNVVYLRDFQKRAFLRGVGTLGTDEAQTMSALRRLLAELGAPRTFVMGSSSGGFSALRYGALLGANDAISFAGPTLIASYFGSTAVSVWNPSYLVHMLLQNEKDLPLDLVPVLRQADRTRSHQFYGADNPSDVSQAQRLQGLPKVLLRPVPAVADHLVVDHMIGNGSFDALIEELADAPGTTAQRRLS